MNDPSVSGQSKLGLVSPEAFIKVGQNPFKEETTLDYHIKKDGHVSILVYDITGKVVKVLQNQELSAGTYQAKWRATDVGQGTYIARVLVDGQPVQSVKLSKIN
jgi:flagellar hook assembly protein FlgD